MNEGIIHARCAEERRQIWQEQNAKTVIVPGDLVRKAFVGDNNRDEHMWVEVTKVEGNVITSTLANDPLHMKDIKYGDKVVFDRSEISQLLK